MTNAPAAAEHEAILRPFRARRLSNSDFDEGDVLAGKYRVEAVLGEGGMGIVLRAMHMDLGCQVAIKVMRPGLAQHDEAVNRLLVEAQAAASIRSEHVARVLDVGHLDSGAPYLVLEYLDGRDLSQILSKLGHLDSQVAVDFVLQACEALSEAHGAGVVHRDLKPENLFLCHRPDGTPVIKVLDFGISKRSAPQGREAARTNPSDLLGSPLYMAPEQMRGSADIDARADIWSLGVVLYELCTGQSPFFGESIPAICARVIGIEPAPPCSLMPSLPSGLQAIIQRCLQKEPAQRPANIAELATALAAYGSAPSERAPRALSATLAVVGQGLCARKPRRFQPRVTLVGAALAFATLLGGALTLRAGHASEATTQSSLAQNIAQTPEPANCRLPSVQGAASKPPPSNAAPLRENAAHVTLVKHALRNGTRNPWDPKSFGGRL
jgi:serine/threonine-protein kinase